MFVHTFFLKLCHIQNSCWWFWRSSVCLQAAPDKQVQTDYKPFQEWIWNCIRKIDLQTSVDNSDSDELAAVTLNVKIEPSYCVEKWEIIHVMQNLTVGPFYPTAAQSSGKNKWREAEVQAVERHMMRFIEQHKIPQKNDCIQCLEAEPEALRARSWKGVKDYVRNRITALTRQGGTFRAASTNSNWSRQEDPQHYWANWECWFRSKGQQLTLFGSECVMKPQQSAGYFQPLIMWYFVVGKVYPT